MSSTTTDVSSSTTSSAVATSTGVCSSNLYDTPVHDVVCAVPYKEDNIGFMTDCCKGAEVVSYYDNCGLFCLVVDQSVEDLSQCLFGKKVAYQDVFCRGNGTDRATGTSNPELPATASASAVGSSATSSATSSSGSKDDSSKSDDSKSKDDKNAASGLSVSVLGLAIGTLLFTTFTLA